MKNTIKILGLDPGFASLGWFVAELQNGNDAAIAAGVCRTEKSAKKLRVLASDDNLRRCRSLAGTIHTLIQDHQISAICVESMSFPRNASVATKLGQCWGVIAAASRFFDLPVIQVSPQEIKKQLCGRKDAPKEDIAIAVRERYANIQGLMEQYPRSVHEHMFDAAGAVIVSLENSETVLALRVATKV